jgi:cysteine synthase B
MIEDGEKAGLLTKDKIILDSTSGNTGIAYALIGKIKGYKVQLVMPENICRERKAKMAHLYGADIIYSDPFGGSDGAIIKAKEIYEKSPEKFYMPDQYNNPSNWKAHFETTAREVYDQTDNRVTHFIAGIGTGGTITGAGRGLKKINPSIQIYAVEPQESLHGLEGLKHMDTSIVPDIYDPSILDGKISVKTEEAYEMVRSLENEEGLQVGNSSGAAMVGTLELAKKIKRGVIVTVFPDCSDKCYISKVV